MDAEMASANQALVEATLTRGGADLASCVLPSPGSRYVQYWTAPIYARMIAIERRMLSGCRALLLAGLALCFRTNRKGDARFWLAVAAVGVVISLGSTVMVAGRVVSPSPLYNLLYGFPPLSQFRIPSRTAVTVLLGASLWRPSR